jgi:SAM-dependent methyltransferase
MRKGAVDVIPRSRKTEALNSNATIRDDADRMALRANLALFDQEGTAKLVERSPHLKHASVRQLYEKLVLQVFSAAQGHANVPRVLDVGAGDGSATLPFLQLGARVTAVDMSESQLEVLREKCRAFSDKLEVRLGTVGEILNQTKDRYDIITMNSFLHHVPDYLGTIREAVKVLQPRGQFFSFQDPLRYDTLAGGSLFFSRISYFGWRLFQGGYVRGLKTRLRRIRGVYISGSEEDDGEYHVTRNGVDQDAIAKYLESDGFSCQLVPYFSTQGAPFQVIGEYLGVKNTFGIVAQRGM